MGLDILGPGFQGWVRPGQRRLLRAGSATEVTDNNRPECDRPHRRRSKPDADRAQCHIGTDPPPLLKLDAPAPTQYVPSLTMCQPRLTVRFSFAWVIACVPRATQVRAIPPEDDARVDDYEIVGPDHLVARRYGKSYVAVQGGRPLENRGGSHLPHWIHRIKNYLRNRAQRPVGETCQ